MKTNNIDNFPKKLKPVMWDHIGDVIMMNSDNHFPSSQKKLHHSQQTSTVEKITWDT